MSATNRRLYKITIKLINNDVDEKEFIIDNMKQISLDNFAEKGMPLSITDNSFIYMINEPYYINNDVLQKIREISKSENKKFSFPSFSSMTPHGIRDTFYASILNNSDNKLKRETMLEIVEFIIYFFNNYDIAGMEKQNSFIKRYNASLTKIKDDLAEFKKFIVSDRKMTLKFTSEYDSIFINILCEKDVMTYLKSRFENYTDEKSLKFKQNLTSIMTKNSSDNSIMLNKVDKYQYFMDTKYIDYIFDNIHSKINESTKQQDRYSYYNQSSLINTNETRKQIITENMKYVYSNKTSIDLLDDNEENDIILFHNILYIIKKIYLLDTTIINAKDIDTDLEKKFYIKNLTLEKANSFKISRFIEKNTTIPMEFYNVTIKFTCDIKYINFNPILKINYIIDDVEILDKDAPLKTIEFDPKTFNNNENFSKYNLIYIYDTLNYISNENKINSIFNTIKVQKIIKNKEEIFFNETALNEFNQLLIPGKNNKIPSTEELKAIKDKNIFPNILYFLKDIIKLYNSKEITYNNNKYFVYDTLIQDASNNTYYSISQNKVVKHNNIKTIKLEKNMLKKKELLNINHNDLIIPAPSSRYKFDVFRKQQRDARIESDIYYIFIVLLCYKADENGKKPSYQKRAINELCLERASILDKAFYKLFYNKFNIPEMFLYNKLLKLNKSKQAVTLKNKDRITNEEYIDTPSTETNIRSIIKGGTKKYTHKKKPTYIELN